MGWPETGYGYFLSTSAVMQSIITKSYLLVAELIARKYAWIIMHRFPCIISSIYEYFSF